MIYACSSEPRRRVVDLRRARKLRRCDFTCRKRARRIPPRCEDTPLYVATTKYCEVYPSFKKQSKTQAVQEARGKPEGAYIDVRNRGLPQRDAEIRQGLTTPYPNRLNGGDASSSRHCEHPDRSVHRRTDLRGAEQQRRNATHIRRL